MHKGFNLTLENSDFNSYTTEGQLIHSNQKNKIKSTLNSFTDPNGNLIGSKISANWFPKIEANVFISHSHKDNQLAINLSGWLKNTFGLTSFIDSCVWGYSDELLKIIDKKYCYSDDKETYDYQKRNRSTSHVYMMLSTALSNMMYNTECLIFLNTPASISSEKYIEGDITDSPWIYSEIAMSKLIEKRDPSAHRLIAKADSIAKEAMDESLKVKYEVSLDHLTKISKNDLWNWDAQCKRSQLTGADTLNKLYNFS